MATRSKLSQKLRKDLAYQNLAFRHSILSLHKKQDSEQIHQLRIQTRRLRALLWLLKNEHQAAFPKLAEHLRRLNNKLGKCREFDVLCKDAKKYHFKIQDIRKQRTAAHQDLKEFLGKKRVQKILRELKPVLQFANARKLEFLKANVKLKKRLLKWKGHLPKRECNYHKLRITVKKTRYAMEAQHIQYPAFKEVQDQLGKAHDLEVLQNFFGRHKSLTSKEEKHLKRARKYIEDSFRFVEQNL